MSAERLGLSIQEACEALGVGRTFFYEMVYPELKLVRRGRRVIVPVDELKRWMDRNGAVKAS
jgi:excisionase family DNA binding protein